MRLHAALALALVLAFVLAGCLGFGPAPASDDRVRDVPLLPRFANVTVVLDTSHGEIAIEMLSNKSPVTVANFLQYVDHGHYDGTIFHRVVKKSNASCIGIIQGGGLTSDLKPKGIDLGPIPLEEPRNLSHVVGTVAMARTDEKHSATTQFFLNVEDSTCLDRPSSGYAIFGRVVEGLDVAQRIQAMPTVKREAFTNLPFETVAIRKARAFYPVGGDRALELASLHEGYKIAPNGSLAFPVLVKNLGEVKENVTLQARPSDAALIASFERSTLSIAPGEWVPVILRLEGSGAAAGVANVTVEATSGALTARHVVTFRVAQAAGPAADGDANGRVKVSYVGLYGNAAVFDSNVPLPRNVRVFPTTNRPQFEPFPVWLGEGSTPAGYSVVIPGFRDATLGLRVGETATVRLHPSQAYDDGHERLFEVTVLAIDPPT